MNDPIEVFSENYLNGDCTISVISGDALKGYLYDQKYDTKWVSSGSDDLTTERIDITFKNWQGEEVNRTFDRIVILNHNFKAISADYYDGAYWVPITGIPASLSASDSVLEASAPITASRMRVNCDTAQVTDAEKYAGELKICLNLVSLGLASTTWNPEGEQKSGFYRLVGGALVAWKEWTKIAGTLSMENVAKATKDILLPYMKAASFITLIFHSDFDASEVYEFSIVSAPAWAVNRKTELFMLDLELKER